MTADPWALLREAKRLIAANRLMLGHYSGVREVGSLEDCIDAALAAHRDEVPAQDSAEDVVEWHAYGYARNELRSHINGADVTVRFLAPNMSDIDTQYSWNVSLWGGATTLTEAKKAAIAAARGMR
jgi:hypothetical protein